jgi:L-ascorbate metabolism protein UlaG (beta-lactamase superfamily)
MKSVFGTKAKGARLERMKASPRWVDGSFRNVHPMLPKLRARVDMPTIAEFLCGGGRRVPVAPLPSLDPRPTWKTKPGSGLRTTWLGHSTLLIEIDGARILTDPVWGPRASPLSVAGPKRFQPVPVKLAEMPHVDLVLLSHDHYDHLDYKTIRALAKTNVPFVTSLGVGAHLESWGVAATRITELDWWESYTLPRHDLTITAAPSQHFSGRTITGRNSTLWSSYAIKGPRHSVFFGADTGLTTQYVDIAKRLGPFDLVMLEVGAYHPAWGDIHLGPDNAIEAYRMLGTGKFHPIHWGTFNLAMHAWDAPAETLIRLAPKNGIELAMPRLGEPIEPTMTNGVEPWWRAVTALEKTRVVEEPDQEPLPAEAASWPPD